MLHMTYDIQAFVRVIQKSQEYESHFIYLLSEECHGCPYNRAYKFNNLNMTVQWYVHLVACIGFFCISEMIAEIQLLMSLV